MIGNVTLPGACFLIDSANQPRYLDRRSEDSLLVTGGLLGVFDSVGGRDQGRLVSLLASKTIAAHWHTLAKTERNAPPEQLACALQTVLQQADATIAKLSISPE